MYLKLFEYCLLSKIEPFFKLNDRQHGFRKNHSTSSACFTLKETVMYYMNANSSVFACFLDIRKAFDSVCHDILFRKLNNLGIPNCLINIMKYWYDNQYVQVKYKSSFSSEWKLSNGVRQGGVLSGYLFNLYIDSLLEKISCMKIGCKLGIIRSNVIAYADDIVLLAPSAQALSLLVEKAYDEASNLHLEFNFEKTKIMRFHSSSRNACHTVSRQFKVNGHSIEIVNSFKYLGFILSDNLSNNDDITRAKKKFYSEFNLILRKFGFTDKYVKLFLFKQYCLQVYGGELWFGPSKSKVMFRQFEVGYHKAIKKLLNLSSHESNHYACQESNLFTFTHFMNLMKINAAIRFISKPCNFIEKLIHFMKVSSVMINEVLHILKETYDIDSLYDNDFDAIVSRITYVQNHEQQMRLAWLPL